MTLEADNFFNDQRLLQAKQLIQEALKDHQRLITSPRPPIKEFSLAYDHALAALSELRGTSLWYPYLGSGFGCGPLVELYDGSIKYDMVSGIGVHVLGHNHPKLVEASLESAYSNSIMQGNLQQNSDALAVYKLLTHHSGLDHCFLTSSGAMACENALKLALHKNSPAKRLLAFENCFMGRTLTLSQISDKPQYRQGIPDNIQVDYIPFFDYRDPEGSTLRASAALKKLINKHPRDYAAMCFELIQGEGGVYPGSEKFFKTLMKVLQEHNIAIIVDEVQTFGRTDKLFAFQHFHLDDYVDIIAIGKLSQVCATLYRKKYRPQPGLISQTFTSSTAAIKAAKVIIEELTNGKYFGDEGRIIAQNTYWRGKLRPLEPRIKGPYGMGAMLAFTPYDGERSRVISFVKRLFDKGVIAFIAGSTPTRVRLLPPYGALTYKDIDDVVAIIDSEL
ncbi:MAG: aminotransferase class III-fold pyridoxal phosphate-dependent enzyme [Chlamydiota bacterium]